MIETQIKIPLSGWLPDDDTVDSAVHLFCPWSTVAVGHGQQKDLSFGRDYLLAVSAGGYVWRLFGDALLVRKMHPKAKEERWGPGKNVQQQIQSLLRKGYKVVGKMDSNGTWTSDHFSYPSQPIITAGTGGAADPLSVRYPLSDKMKKALEGLSGPVWF